jgi:hypothetical protein
MRMYMCVQDRSKLEGVWFGEQDQICRAEMIELASACFLVLAAFCAAVVLLVALLPKIERPAGAGGGDASGTSNFLSLCKRCCSEKRDSVTPGM